MTLYFRVSLFSPRPDIACLWRVDVTMAMNTSRQPCQASDPRMSQPGLLLSASFTARSFYHLNISPLPFM
ncbi:hypothetical protein E2C01_047956 [Portunus trituberculatus]|uniref:Uncharacterized protein n=1 Tax=Portunus trituberculatus TaxID=210409 RepID=A0A5B7G8W1_PORTR|nr:hypothetical protein [Portunus trituberculatus]